MYKTYFELRRKPFLAVPDIDIYCPNSSMDTALSSVRRSLIRGEGISLVFGAPGFGKSFLLRHLGKSFQEDYEEYSVVSITNGPIRTPKGFFQQILFGLRQPFLGIDEQELRLQLLKHINESARKDIILLIDEAQTLPWSVFEEIRQLSNCDDGKISRIRIALAGMNTYEERLMLPKATAFNHRVVTRCYLEPLSRKETEAYINKQIEPKKLFEDASVRLIHQYTEGVPRLINQLCDIVLLMAAHRKELIVGEQLVRSAWANLQQLPEPEVSPTTEERAIEESFPNGEESLIEFGSLLDEEFQDEKFEPMTAIIENNLVETSKDEEDVDEITLENPQPEAPGYVYLARSVPETAYPKYPGYPGDGTVFFNWIAPGHQIDSGIGVPYRDVISDEYSEPEIPQARKKEKPVIAAKLKTEIVSSNERAPSVQKKKKKTILDETFEETILVDRYTRCEKFFEMDEPLKTVKFPAVQAENPEIAQEPVKQPRKGTLGSIFDELSALQEVVSNEVEMILREEILESTESGGEPESAPEAWMFSEIKCRLDIPVKKSEETNQPHIPVGSLELESRIRKKIGPVPETKKTEEDESKKSINFNELFSKLTTKRKVS